MRINKRLSLRLICKTGILNGSLLYGFPIYVIASNIVQDNCFKLVLHQTWP